MDGGSRVVDSQIAVRASRPQIRAPPPWKSPIWACLSTFTLYDHSRDLFFTGATRRERFESRLLLFTRIAPSGAILTVPFIHIDSYTVSFSTILQAPLSDTSTLDHPAFPVFVLPCTSLQLAMIPPWPLWVPGVTCFAQWVVLLLCIYGLFPLDCPRTVAERHVVGSGCSCLLIFFSSSSTGLTWMHICATTFLYVSM